MEYTMLLKILKENGLAEDKIEKLSKEIHEDYTGEITAEKNKGIEEYRKKDGELMKHKAILKEFGYSPETDGDVKSFLEKIKMDPEKLKALENDKSGLLQKIESLTSKLQDIESKSILTKTKADQNLIKSTLIKELDSKIYGAPHLIESLINNKRVSVDENDTVIGYDNGNKLALQDLLKKVMEENKDILKTTMSGGSGDPGTKGDSFVINKDISLDDALANISEIKKEIGL